MSIYDAIKDAVNIAQKADNIELYRILLDVQKQSSDLLEENNSLKKQIDKLIDDSHIDKTLIFKHNCYYKEDDKNFEKPFCTNCWDNNRKLIRMHIYDSSIGAIVQCNTCKVDFYYNKTRE
ncbi:hypothetical protein [Clostridium sp. Cult2]|uniref:hypothetical protein n=1 Tax=Clostridium sp. Cult2 TaxID=2079003 RepID=UPI001F44A356|nr:hypothetical protein [Clostridium sp. Cult2]MCF6466361.1 hypothetical protein [Clostridium sp. Cult2]